jgi:hypothetical protein
VEVLDPDGEWYGVDATPPPSTAAADTGSWLAFLTAEASALWARVTSFDARRRDAAIAWLLELPERAVAAAWANPAVVLAAALVVVGIWLGRGRGRRAPRAVRAYARAVLRAGLVRAPAETPRALLRRARGTGLGAVKLGGLRQATLAHERERYAGREG